MSREALKAGKSLGNVIPVHKVNCTGWTALISISAYFLTPRRNIHSNRLESGSASAVCWPWIPTDLTVSH